jgi:hypothetical protein
MINAKNCGIRIVGSEVEYLQAKNAKKKVWKNKWMRQKEALDMYYIKADLQRNHVDKVNIKVGQNVAPGVSLYYRGKS